ncbi:hypothetical protein [Streptomyces sp. NBC_01483]|uniref:hypothetical protein n=1 Tax=Streptomyces sp. NBC_01483 TaxID=2903883 RepID=UPI002E378B0E|nr:hypothetical protein [Streptomyces sp. NBC_01483]
MSNRFDFSNAGSAFGQMQRIASNGQLARVHRAYRAYIDHGSTCATCAVDSGQCATAEELWETYCAANSS